MLDPALLMTGLVTRCCFTLFIEVSGCLVYELQELDYILTQEWATCSDVKIHGLWLTLLQSWIYNNDNICLKYDVIYCALFHNHYSGSETFTDWKLGHPIHARSPGIMPQNLEFPIIYGLFVVWLSVRMWSAKYGMTGTQDHMHAFAVAVVLNMHIQEPLTNFPKGAMGGRHHHQACSSVLSW